MDQFTLYIKRLISFILCAFLFVFLSEWVSIYILAPILVLAFSVIHSRITGQNPPHLFAFYRTELFFNKGGLRDLLRIPLVLLALTYDGIIWMIWGLYLVFLLIVDLIDSIKTLAYWLIRSFIWFLKQYVPFLIFIQKVFIHYFIRWPWWIYQLSFYNIRYAYNRNCYRIAITGTLLAAFLVFFLFFLEIVFENIPGVSVIGLVLALLPISWSFGEIATLRVQKLEADDYAEVKIKFQNGIETVRSILFYIMLLVVLLLLQVVFNLLGWLNGSGIVLEGFAFTLNTGISFILIILCVLIVFGVLVIPSYRLYNPFSEISLRQNLSLLKSIGRKFHQYLILTIPLSLFSILVMILPLLVALVVYFISYNIKNTVLEVKINKLRTEQVQTNEPITAYRISKEIYRLQELQQFPEGLLQEMDHLQSLSTEIGLYKEDAHSSRAELLLKNETFAKEQKVLSDSLSLWNAINPSNEHAAAINAQLNRLKIQYAIGKSNQEIKIEKANIDVEFLSQKISLIPVLFFMGGLWFVIFGGLIFAFAVSYMGNVYHQLFLFRNDILSSEFQNVVKQQREKDAKQPLLGGTLLIITIIVIICLAIYWPFRQSIQEIIDRWLN